MASAIKLLEKEEINLENEGVFLSFKTEECTTFDDSRCVSLKSVAKLLGENGFIITKK